MIPRYRILWLPNGQHIIVPVDKIEIAKKAIASVEKMHPFILEVATQIIKSKR